MARKKKGAVAMQAAAPATTAGHERMNTSIDSAENGFIVHVSGETGGKTPNYFSKRFIATSRPQALRIAAHHMSGKGKGGRKKGKGALLKKSVA